MCGVCVCMVVRACVYEQILQLYLDEMRQKKVPDGYESVELSHNGTRSMASCSSPTSYACLVDGLSPARRFVARAARACMIWANRICLVGG